ncbi:MAG: DNA alkylation repair protein, partial [Bacteroidetes bacterium]|nr:DNA alkylation repair protein [Bacteroidota bacterium]
LFKQHSDASKASFMKKYMKGQYEYFGIPSPERREIMREFLQLYGMPEHSRLGGITHECWELPQREYQYFIMEVLERLAKKAESGRIDLYEYLLENKSWWDTIDFISAVLIGIHFQKYPEQIIPYTEKWMKSGNKWLQRSSLLFQLKYKKKTDLELMTRYIGQLQGSKEFFINKAIGWVLREYSKTDGPWVMEYVSQNNLATLSHREAVKWMERKKEKHREL